MIEHEKIPNLNIQQREILYKISDRLLATIDFPTQSPVARFRDAAVREILKVNMVAILLGLAVVGSTIKSTADNTIIASGHEKIIPTPTLTQTPNIVLPSPMSTPIPPPETIKNFPITNNNRFGPSNPNNLIR